ncbi:NADH-quinone oxidoreductase subunit J [Candidatus Palibaumannia cicadellinicola]|uniref:NADH-quinone oxidoreductase subunit J n=1 Tax=Candidatus Palibaumannia cicadellinicola TaxID=186490 RepID=A0A0K2BKQ4_9GAMM|nr:NADH-quinone oxidoreductase subunit J [Candidatus Baumannia cicadellinicola]AKZ65915.1 NADH-ubiquinone oxidoreductase chain J [Candidatus Baumannia cicadellinicola]
MELIFYFSGLIAILSVLRVITHSKPIPALLYFIISLLAIASIFFCFGAYFAGALEIIVYAGAVMVLFIFVMMILNISESSQLQAKQHELLKPIVWLVPSLLSIGLLILLLHVFLGTAEQHIINNSQIIDTKIVGISLFGPYILAVELASMLLLASMIASYHLGYKASYYHNKKR